MKLPPPFQPLSSSAYRLFVGVDIAARTAVAAWIVPGEPVTRPITIEQSAAGFASLQEQLLATGVAVMGGKCIRSLEHSHRRLTLPC